MTSLVNVDTCSAIPLRPSKAERQPPDMVTGGGGSLYVELLGKGKGRIPSLLNPSGITGETARPSHRRRLQLCLLRSYTAPLSLWGHYSSRSSAQAFRCASLPGSGSKPSRRPLCVRYAGLPGSAHVARLHPPPPVQLPAEHHGSAASRAGDPAACARNPPQ